MGANDPEGVNENQTFSSKGTLSKNVLAARKAIETLSKADTAAPFADKLVRLYPSSIIYVWSTNNAQIWNCFTDGSKKRDRKIRFDIINKSMAVPSKRKKQGDAGSRNTTKNAKSSTKKVEEETDEVEDENEDEPLTPSGPKKGPKSEPKPFSKPATKPQSTPTTPLSLGKGLNPTDKLNHLISISVQSVPSSVHDPQANIISQEAPSSPTQISITDS